jgi:hypothetical protein
MGRPMPDPAFYARTARRGENGSLICQTNEDAQIEREIAAIVSAEWNCKVRHFPPFSPIDWYAERSGRVAGLLEVKNRSVSTGQYPTVFCTLRKWLSLSYCSMAFFVPGIFVVRFTDDLLWVDIGKIQPPMMREGGTAYRPNIGRRVAEPMLEIPMAELRRVRRS